MRVELTADGYIKIIAETTLEAWALNGVWPLGQDVMDRENNVERFIIDCSVLKVPLKD